MGAETVLEIEEGGGLTGHADVDPRSDAADLAHELLGRAAQRPLRGGDGEQRIVRAGRLRGRDGGDVREPGDPRTHGLEER